MPRGRSLTLVSALLCFAGGMLNGITGAGSGIFFMLTASLITRGGGKCDMFSLTMICVSLISALSLAFYPAEAFDFSLMLPLIPPAGFGGLLGGILKKRLGRRALKLLFAALCVYSGLSMLG